MENEKERIVVTWKDEYDWGVSSHPYSVEISPIEKCPICGKDKPGVKLVKGKYKEIACVNKKISTLLFCCRACNNTFVAEYEQNLYAEVL